jgi:PAS domain S-box-containing protein
MARPSREGIIIFFRDVTDRRRREDALRESEERYRVLAELNPQALWTADVKGRVWYANQRFLEYIGKDFLPQNGREYLQYFHEADRQRVNDVWAHSIATGEEYVVDARMIRASDGAARWWHLRALPVRDEHGHIEQWLGTAIDVHDTRRAAEQLRQQYALVESSRDFVALSDMQGTPIYGNRAALKLIGLHSLADFTRVPMKDFFFPEDQNFITNEFFPKVLREGHGEVEIRLRHFQTGEPIWMNYHVFLLRDASGEPVAYGTVSRDVTAQKRAETALMQSEKLAAVGRLASSIAHEINNPLESVTNLLFLAREHGGLPEEVQNFLDTADQELRRVSIIASQTLRFHKQSTRPQAVDGGDLFTTVLSIYEGRFKNSKIAIEKRTRAKKPVVCFEGEIRQVLNNMVSNAIDAMPKGGRLLVRSHEATDWKSSRRGVVLTVADTGSGIDPQARSKMFEPFFTTKGFGGTGLGLWVSAEIMKRHQGRIKIRSSQQENHRGTVVKLFLPFNTSPAEKASLHSPDSRSQ